MDHKHIISLSTKKRAAILFVLLIGIFHVCTIAQSPISFTTKDGLPSNHVYDIKQDSDGYMWFATNRGVAKFDGSSFRTFTTKDGLPNNDIWLLETDDKGRVWFFSKSKYQGYIQDDRVFSFITEDSTVISPLIYRSSDNIRLMSNRGLYELKDSVFMRIMGLPFSTEEYTKLYEKYKLNSDKGFLIPDYDNKKFILTDGNQTIVFDKELNFLNKLLNKDAPNSLGRHSFFTSGVFPGNLHFISNTNGVYFTDLNIFEATSFFFKPLIGVEEVSTVKIISSQNEIQISVPGHLMVLNNELDIIRQYSFPEDIPNQSSFQDRDGNIWLTHLSQGVSLIPNNQTQTRYYLKDKAVQKIGKIGNQIFAGVKNEGFYKIDPKKYHPENKIINSDYKAYGNIYKIREEEGSTGSYLIAVEGGYKYYDSIFFPIKGIFDNQSRSKDILLFKDSEYRIQSGGVYICSSSDNNCRPLIDMQGLSNLELFDSEMYISGNDGLFVLRKDTILARPARNKDLLTLPVLCLQSGEDYLSVGTDGRGVYLYNEKEIIHLENTDGLIVQKIIQKDPGFLWLATQKGVVKLALDSVDMGNSQITFTLYDVDGLFENNTNDIYLEDSLLYVASDQGLSLINLNSRDYKNKPKIVFNTPDSLIVRSDQNDRVSATFSVLDFVNQEYFEFAYKMKPMQDEWVNTTSKTLNFSNLSPKEYILEFKAKDHHSNESIEKIFIKVMPAWWQTLIARIGFGLIILLGFYLIFTATAKRIRKKEKQKSETEKRIAGLELQALRSQMNPHFVHNSLNAIQYFIQRNEVELSENYLVKFSKLVRLFFEYSRKQTITIEDEVRFLDHYLQIEKLRFEDKLTYEIHVDEAIDQEEQIIPSMILQPIVENAVNHGLFHKKGKGALRVSFTYQDPTSFMVKVKDNGIGINQAKKIYKHSSRNYQSKSSHVLEERLELLAQSKDWKITYDIQDISDQSDESGTIVNMTFNQP